MSSEKKKSLTYKQPLEAQHLAQHRQKLLDDDITEVLEYIQDKAKELSQKHSKPLEYIEQQLYQSKYFNHQKREVNVCNAARQIEAALEGRKGEVTEEDTMVLQEIQKKIAELGSPEKAAALPEDLRKFLVEKARGWRDVKANRKRITTAAITQDISHTLDGVKQELAGLHTRTRVEWALFIVKGREQTNFEPSFCFTDKAHQYFVIGLKKRPGDMVKEIELFVLSHIEGLLKNHNDRISNIKSKIRNLIREGLANITGDPKACMHYEKYDKLLISTHGVELVNWPKELVFANPSELSSLPALEKLHAALTNPVFENRCRWVKLSEEEWTKRQKEITDQQLSQPLPTRKCRNIEEPADDNMERPQLDNGGSGHGSAPKAKPKKQRVNLAKENNPVPQSVNATTPVGNLDKAPVAASTGVCSQHTKPAVLPLPPNTTTTAMHLPPTPGLSFLPTVRQSLSTGTLPAFEYDMPSNANPVPSGPMFRDLNIDPTLS